MKIAIASYNNNIDSKIDLHFGRCIWFCIKDTKTGSIEFIENTFSDKSKNAGYKAVKLIKQKDVETVVAGRFGSKVMNELNKNNIQMIIPDENITIKEFINKKINTNENSNTNN